MNILLTSVGRRVYLVDWFRQVLAASGVVAACDLSPHAPGLRGADLSIVVPAVDDPFYIGAIREICREHDIDLVVPLHDLDLHYLSLGERRLAEVGARVVAPSPDVVRQCFDKLAAGDFLESIGVPHPRTVSNLDEALERVDLGELALPVVVKPRWGSASFGIEYVTHRDDVRSSYRRVEALVRRSALSGLSDDDCGEVLVQEFLSGYEYHLDVVNDLDGSYVVTLPKLKLAMRSGETDKAVTVQSEELERLGEQLGTALGHVGNLDVDVIVAGGVATVLEMNPRFGGGYPFAHIAGANLPGAIVAWANGLTPRANWLQTTPNVVSAKYERVAIVSGSADAIPVDAVDGELSFDNRFPTVRGSFCSWEIHLDHDWPEHIGLAVDQD